jgi:GntR family transcriptional regulator
MIMTEQINKFSGIPYYIQLKNILERKIASNEFKGHKLPSEYELAEMYNITKPTVRKTLSKLREEGKIYTLKGIGTFIQRTNLTFGLAKYLKIDFSVKYLDDEVMQKKVYIEEKKFTRSDKKIFNEFSLDYDADKVIYQEIIRYIHDEAIAIQREYLNYNILKNKIKNLKIDQKYYSIIDDMGIIITSVKEYIQPARIEKKDAKILSDVEGSPTFLVSRIAYANNNAWIEFRRVIIKSDKCRFEIGVF